LVDETRHELLIKVQYNKLYIIRLKSTLQMFMIKSVFFLP